MPPKGWKKVSESEMKGATSVAISSKNERDPRDDEEEIKRWSDIISSTVQWRDQIAEKNGWKRFIQEYSNNWDDLKRQIDIPMQPVNYIFSYVKTEISRLYFKDPWISVNPKRMDDIASSKIAEQAINYTWSIIDLKRQVKLALTDAILVGHGWIKLGYTAEFGTVESKSKDENGKITTNVDPNIVSENVFAVHYPWDHVIFDPSSSWPATTHARWMAFKWIKPLKAIQESGIYENTEDLRASDKPYSNENGPANNIQSVVGWEIWDRDAKKVLTIVPGYNKKLREIPWPKYISSGFPAVMLSFNPVPGNPYPLSDIAPQEGQIHEMIKMMAIMHNHLKRWNRQIFIHPQLMTEEAKSNFKNAIDGAVIEANGDFQKDFFIPPYAPVQQDIYGVWALTNDVWRNTIGQSDQERGANVKSTTRTLGELRLALQGSRSRAEEKLDSLEDAIAEIARKLLSIMQDTYDIPKMIRIVGKEKIDKSLIKNRPSATGPMKDKSQTSLTEDGSIYSFTATNEDMKGEMDVSVVAGSTVPLNKENQLKTLESVMPQVLQLYGPKAGRELFREYLRLINIKSLERIADIAEEEAMQAEQNPAPNPEVQKSLLDMKMSQQKLQMDMQAQQMNAQLKTQQEQVKLEAEKQKSQIEIQGLMAKTQADIVKAKADIEKTKMKVQADLMKNVLQRARGENIYQ